MTCVSREPHLGLLPQFREFGDADTAQDQTLRYLPCTLRMKRYYAGTSKRSN